MTSERTQCPYVALSDPGSYAAGHPVSRYAEVRRACPVSWQEDAGGYFAVTGMPELLEVSRQPAAFCSGAGNKLKDDSYARLGEDIDIAMRGVILATDPPLHTTLRAALAPFFAPQSIRELEPKVRQRARESLDAAPRGTPFDLVRTVTAPFPIRVLCDLMEVPESDRERIYDWTQRLTGADDPDFNVTPAQAAQAFREVFDYGRAILAARRAAPGRDIISAFAALQVDGKPLEQRYTDAFFALLVAAGNETTRNAITGVLHELGRNPEQRTALLQDPTLIRNAVEEGLRFASPVIHMRRTAVGEQAVGNVHVHAGQRLGLFYGAANRDERVFSDPDRFDVRRKNARTHVAFGYGQHVCLGAPLARLEIRVFLEEFLARFPSYEVESAPACLRSDFVAGIKRLTVTLR